MHLYVDPLATSCRAVVATVNALRLDVDLVELSLMRGDHRSAGFLEVNPSGKVPVLIDEGFRLTESTAIIRYLCDKFCSPLGGEDIEQRARVDEAMSWLSSTISISFCQGVVYPQMLPQFAWSDPDVASAVGARALAQTNGHLDHLEAILIERGPFLLGEDLTVADFVGVAMLSLGDAVQFSFGDRPGLLDWMARVTATPAWSRLAEIMRPHLEAYRQI